MEPETEVKSNVMKPIVPPSLGGNKLSKNTLMLGLVVVVILSGVLIGWLIAGGNKNAVSGPVVDGIKVTADEAGVKDESVFKDSAEGVLEEGGIGGEGSYHLVRDGGVSQYVYLTSTTIDISSFVGKKVKVWGETLAARKAGWLMDVGKIKKVE